ncbi:hypothetical protein [Oligella urethralis]|uniref:Uncharacterized protein n=1 Tax=Oligella urethralis DNF00040 TaxID=1401065 RepID=A0A095YT98_9BURK|nr:hypothetical protein [Oligella urethralis]KGF25356.1 hypothetical protein HMPREF2130_11255 [Oligella urethralis DNF00040]
MKKGFFRIFVVLSFALTIVGGFLIYEPVSNIHYKIQMHKKGGEIFNLVEDYKKQREPSQNSRDPNASGDEWRDVVLKKIREKGYSDEAIYFYLYGHNDLKAKIESLAKADVGSSYYAKKKEVFNYFGIKEPGKGDYYYDGAKDISYSEALFYIFSFIIVPVALLWIMFYTIVWIAAGFRKSS